MASLLYAILAQAGHLQLSFLLFGWSMWPAAHVTDLPGIIAHFGVRDAVWQSFCAAVGDCGPDIRPLANLPPTLVTQSITAARLEGGRRLTPLEAIQVGMIYRACHRQVHLSKALPLEIWVDPDPWTTSLPSSSTPTGSGTSPSTTSMERKLKFAQVIDQSDESEFLVEMESNKSKYYAKYLEKVGGLPADSEDPSIEQISALVKKMMQHKQPPYCDFAVFVPFAKKHLRAQKYQSFILQEDGTFLSKMVPGPENFAHWQASFRVMRTAFIMTEIITLNNLMQWESMIERMNRQFPSCWGLVAAADDRARGEYMSKTLPKMKMEFAQGSSPPIGWVEDQPWNHVWVRVLKDRDYWNDQFYVPAMTWTARGAKGTPLTPMEEEANVGLRGGHRALQVETEDNLVNKEGDGRRGHNKARRETKDSSRKRRVEELEEWQWERRKGWRKQGWCKGQRWKWCSQRRRMLRVEQWEWSLRWTIAWRTMPSKNQTNPQMHHLQVDEPPEQRMPSRSEEELNYFLGFVMVMAGEGQGEGTSKRGQHGESSGAGDTAPDRSGISRNLDEKKGTKRKRTTGEDPPREDGGEPPPNKIHVEGDYLTFEEYLARRHFVFIHHYSGEQTGFQRRSRRPARTWESE